MTHEQRIAMTKFRTALREATDAGLFDILIEDMSDPDAINELCDAVDDRCAAPWSEV